MIIQQPNDSAPSGRFAGPLQIAGPLTRPGY
jgi:hypothetical protein